MFVIKSFAYQIRLKLAYEAGMCSLLKVFLQFGLNLACEAVICSLLKVFASIPTRLTQPGFNVAVSHLFVNRGFAIISAEAGL